MKIVFWNIGKDLSAVKLYLIREIIEDKLPDIFCIAEGSNSKKDCEEIENLCKQKGYECYYSPLFSRITKLNLIYKYKPLGLKIFVKDLSILVENFHFGNQREDGRIVALKATINHRKSTLIFLHNFSKDNREVTLEQIQFISRLSDMTDVKLGNIAKDTERVIIIGDFNLEPWDNILRHKKFLRTSFIKKHDSLHKRNVSNQGYYFNPLVEFIVHAQIANLGGTYFDNNFGWALFDYVLYNTQQTQLSYDIITRTSGRNNLLDTSNTKAKDFLNLGLDHLPIIIEIEN